MMYRVRGLLLLCLALPSLVWGQTQVINGNRVQAGWTNYGITSGTGTAYTLTFTPALPGYVAGQCFVLKPHVSNTGPATLNAQGLGIKSFVKRSGSSLVPLVAGDLLGQQLMQVCYDGTNMQLMGAAAEAISSTGVTDGDKQDITVSGGGTVWSIDSGAVGYSKLPMTTAAARLLGRGSTGPGTWEEVSLGPSLSMSGTQLNVTSGVTDGDKQDITVSGSGTVWTIDNTAVTYAKMQNVTTARLLGRTTAGVGSMEELTEAQVKTMLGLAFGDIMGVATDAQIPDLNTLLTGLTPSRCVETDGTGKLGVASGLCGTTGATTGISGATNHGLMVATGGTTGSSLGVATNGQLPIGSTGADPVLGSLNGTANQIRVTPGPGTITLDLPPAGVTLPGTTTIGSGSTLTTSGTGIVNANQYKGTAVVAPVDGGTGLSTAPDDNLLIGNGTVWQLKALPNCAATNETLRYTAATNLMSCGTVTTGASTFDAIAGGTNTTAAMVVGTGASLAPSGTGTITATALATNPAPCGTNLFVTDTAANGTLTCTQPTFANLAGVPNALDDGTTKGVATFTNNDFDCPLGVCSIAYATAQAASGATKGFLTSGDWTMFNTKQNALTFTPEDVARKNNAATLGTSTVDYPTQGAVKSYVDTGTKALSNTALTPRPCALADTATLTINANHLTGCDYIQVDQLTSPTPVTVTLTDGLYVNAQFFTLRIFTTAQRALTFTTGPGKFGAEGMTLPTFTRAGGYVLYGFSYNAHSNRWALASSNQTTNYGTAGYVQTAQGNGVEPIWAPFGGGITASGPPTAGQAAEWTSPTNVTGVAVTGAGSYVKAANAVPTCVGSNALQYTAATNLWSCAAVASGGGTGDRLLPVTAANFPATDPATLDGSENNARLLFDATVRQCAYWGPFRMNPDYASAPVFKWQYSMLSGAAAGVVIDVQVAAVTPGDAGDVNTKAYAAVNTCTQTSAALGLLQEISCPLTINDNLAARDLVKIQVCRNFNHASDVHTGTMEGLAAALEYTK